MIDSYRHKGLRRQLVETLKTKGITNEKILQAIEKVPRHFFFDSSFLEFAYEDKAFPIGAGQTISQPYTVAYQTQLMQINDKHRVLEIGTGSGYQACILAELGAKVFTIERQKTLYTKTKALLRQMDYFQIKTYYGDGYKGLPTYAPFDRILVTAAAPYVPKPLLEQLKVGGLLVIPLGAGETQVMTVITRLDEKNFSRKEFGAFRFVPMLGDKAND